MVRGTAYSKKALWGAILPIAGLVLVLVVGHNIPREYEALGSFLGLGLLLVSILGLLLSILGICDIYRSERRLKGLAVAIVGVCIPPAMWGTLLILYDYLVLRGP